MKFAEIYASGVVMGLSPREVDRLSLWEFAACVEGFNRAQGTGSPPDLSDDEFEAAAALAGWD